MLHGRVLGRGIDGYISFRGRRCYCGRGGGRVGRPARLGERRIPGRRVSRRGRWGIVEVVEAGSRRHIGWGSVCGNGRPCQHHPNLISSREPQVSAREKFEMTRRSLVRQGPAGWWGCRRDRPTVAPAHSSAIPDLARLTQPNHARQTKFSPQTRQSRTGPDVFLCPSVSGIRPS